MFIFLFCSASVKLRSSKMLQPRLKYGIAWIIIIDDSTNGGQKGCRHAWWVVETGSYEFSRFRIYTIP